MKRRGWKWSWRLAAGKITRSKVSKQNICVRMDRNLQSCSTDTVAFTTKWRLTDKRVVFGSLPPPMLPLWCIVPILCLQWWILLIKNPLPGWGFFFIIYYELICLVHSKCKRISLEVLFLLCSKREYLLQCVLCWGGFSWVEAFASILFTTSPLPCLVKTSLCCHIRFLDRYWMASVAGQDVDLYLYVRAWLLLDNE